MFYDSRKVYNHSTYETSILGDPSTAEDWERDAIQYVIAHPELVEYGNIGEKSNFVTQTGADASKLALPPNTNPAIYQEFEVIKEIPGTIQAVIAPWGGSAGGGLQYELPKPILQLIKEGYIVPK